MKRRDFLKAAIAAPVVGLDLKPKKTEPKVCFREAHSRVLERMGEDRLAGIAIERIPKDGYGWVQIAGPAIRNDIHFRGVKIAYHPNLL